jgi:hypothetical protein
MNSATEYNDEQAHDTSTNANANKGPANTNTSTTPTNYGEHTNTTPAPTRTTNGPTPPVPANTAEYECAATNPTANGIKHNNKRECRHV